MSEFDPLGARAVRQRKSASRSSDPLSAMLYPKPRKYSPMRDLAVAVVAIRIVRRASGEVIFMRIMKSGSLIPSIDNSEYKIILQAAIFGPLVGE